jgi:hypothetical protein
MTDTGLNWPKKGDRAFVPLTATADQAGLEAFVQPSEDAYTYGFKRAADMIVDAALREDGNPDDLFFPITYLYRHHLELMLKGLVHMGMQQGEVDMCGKILMGHNLHKLWYRVRDQIKQAWPEAQGDDLKATEQLILELHEHDPSGQAFRYARDSEGVRHLQGAPKRVDLANLKATMDAVSKFLGAAYAGIEW